MVRVKLFANLREIAGIDEIFVDVRSLDELIEWLEKYYPKLKDLLDRGYISVFVNCKLVRSNVPLKNDDVIALLPPVSGG